MAQAQPNEPPSGGVVAWGIWGSRPIAYDSYSFLRGGGKKLKRETQVRAF